MTNYDYLIVGGGMTAGTAMDGIREVDAAGKIGLISQEVVVPNDRPPLSKALWKGKLLDIIWRKLEGTRATIHLNRRVRWVLLWNVWGKVAAARQLIAEPGPFQPANLKGRLN